MEKIDRLKEMDPKLFESGFNQEYSGFLLLRTRVALRIGVPVFMFFWLLDLMVVPEHAWYFLFLRLGACTGFLLVYWLTFTQDGKKFIGILSVSVSYLASLVITGMTIIQGGFESAYSVGIILVCMLSGFFLPWRLGHTLVFCVAILLSYFGLNIAFYGLEQDLALLETLFFLGTACLFTLFGTVANLDRLQREIMLRLETQFVNANLKKLGEAKTRLIANVSHELRTPLTLIVGPIESMLAQDLDARLRSILETVNANARRLLRQVNMLLDMTSIEYGKMRLNPTQLNLAAIMEELTKAARPHASARQIQIEYERSDGFPDSSLDIEKVEIMGSNLLSNAIKFSPANSSIEVRAGYDEDSVFFSVQDSGPGIPVEERTHIFERFYQVDDSRSRIHEGSGLGLALVQELVALHGGSISLSSKVGHGALFLIRLPRKIDSQPERRKRFRRREDRLAAAHAESVTAGQVVASRRAETLFADIGSIHTNSQGDPSIVMWKQDGPRILIVEDNHDLRCFIAESLGNDYHVNTAADGLEGLEIAHRFRPDLVIADIMMPHMDGYELCRKMKESEDLVYVPIILVASKSSPEAIVEGLSAGANDYLVKPFDIRELKARVAAQLRSRYLERKLGETESRLAAIGRMASRIIQDLQVPLQSMMGLTQMLLLDVQEGDEPSQLAVDLHTLTKQEDRLKCMLEELLEYARVGTHQLMVQTIRAKQFLSRLLEKTQRDLERVGIDLATKLELDEDSEVTIDPRQTTRLIETLFHNMRDILSYFDCGGKEHRIWIRAWIESECLYVDVSGNLPGVPKNLSDQFFVPFAVPIEKRHGLGLGLAIASNLAIAHGGKLEFANNESDGNCAFTLMLPCRFNQCKLGDCYDLTPAKMTWPEKCNLKWAERDFISPKTDRNLCE